MATVRRLNLSVQVNNFPGNGWFLHSLPPSFYEARSLNVLELHSLKLEPVFTVHFPSLKVLEIQGCSACRTLRVSCSALEYLSFVFGEQQYDPVLQVLEAANLESVFYYGNGVTNHSMAKFAACSKIRVLSSSEVSICHDECSKDLVFGLQVLETLALRNCTMFRSHLRICSKQLRTLFLRDTYRPEVDQDLIFPKKFWCNASPPLRNVKHIKVKVQKLETKSKLRNSVRWMPPFVETLSVKEEPGYFNRQNLDFSSAPRARFP
ncbi:hypothetical protein TIFTF001_009806 [Ficus carica]|uniref:Uncharacterized protein n=1 Tax=Ficus carica TaxID=3494 RepID=A0AA88D1L7_FICCA|nr:hypothetical protein TIFTF001_009806 [Ficus carica]